MLRLRDVGGSSIGVNFDPSHLFWQQIDPLVSARALAGAIFHVHAKDTCFVESRLALDGVLETRRDTGERAWNFCSIGDGHPVEFWRGLAAALQDAGYDGALSIEHEIVPRARAASHEPSRPCAKPSRERLRAAVPRLDEGGRHGASHPSGSKK
jgi:sugar phosphate isomerase/epimerase